VQRQAQGAVRKLGVVDLPKEITGVRQAMLKAATELDFERAAALRDRLRELERLELTLGGSVDDSTILL
jgi:excinuclease UvrABC helicase subunit UvrB